MLGLIWDVHRAPARIYEKAAQEKLTAKQGESADTQKTEDDKPELASPTATAIGDGVPMLPINLQGKPSGTAMSPDVPFI